MSREEAMAAIREAEIWTGDGGTIEMGSREAADTLLTLARAGAEWMFASDALIDDVARRASYTGPGAPVSVEEWQSPMYDIVREDARKSAARFLRAALAALSVKE